MTPLQQTLNTIVEAFNGAQSLRTVPAVIRASDGKASIELADYLPKSAHSLVVSSATPHRMDADAHWRLAGTRLDVELLSSGIHFTPQPWDASATPVTLDVAVAFSRPPISVPDAPDLEASGLTHFGIDLPAQQQHVVMHGKGSTHFIERMTDADGITQFASVEALDADRVRVTLAEAMPARLDLIFMPDDAGPGA